MKCIKCGNDVPDGNKFCTFCGSELVSNPVNNETLTNFNDVTNVTNSVETDVSSPVNPIVDDLKKSVSKRVDYYKNIGLITFAITTVLFVFLYINSFNKKTDCKCETLNNSTTSTEKTDSSDNNYAKNLDLSNLVAKAEDNTERTNNLKYINYALQKKDYGSDDLSLLFENNNDSLTTGTVYLNYYKDGTRIDSSLGTFSNVLPNSKFVVTIHPKIEEEFDSVDISYKANLKSSYASPVNVDNSKITVEKIKNLNLYDVEASYNNDTDKSVSYYFAIIYIKDGKDVGYHTSGQFNVKSGEKAKVSFHDSLAPEYDSYEVFIQSAYTSNN